MKQDTIEISNVRYGRFNSGKPNENPIEFEVAGKLHHGLLRGRNADLSLGFGTQSDYGIALRVLLDGDSEETKG